MHAWLELLNLALFVFRLWGLSWQDICTAPESVISIWWRCLPKKKSWCYSFRVSSPRCSKNQAHSGPHWRLAQKCFSDGIRSIFPSASKSIQQVFKKRVVFRRQGRQGLESWHERKRCWNCPWRVPTIYLTVKSHRNNLWWCLHIDWYRLYVSRVKSHQFQ